MNTNILKKIKYKNNHQKFTNKLSIKFNNLNNCFFSFLAKFLKRVIY